MDVEVARPVARTAAVPPRDDGLSQRMDSETRRYRNTLDGVYRLFDTVALPPAAVHLMNTTMRGVTHSPLDPPGRACEDAQKWGHHVSLSSPSTRQYRAEYYRMHYPADIPRTDYICTPCGQHRRPRRC